MAAQHGILPLEPPFASRNRIERTEQNVEQQNAIFHLSSNAKYIYLASFIIL